MYKTQVFQLLSQFSTREKSRFQAFLESPFFNKNKAVLSFSTYVLAQKLSEQNPKIKRELVFQTVYGKEAFKEAKFNNLLSDVLHLLYRFLAHSHLEKEPALEQQLLLSHLQDKDLEAWIPRVSRRFRQVQEKNVHQNYEFHYHDYQYYDALDAAFLAKSKHANDPNLQLKNDALDRYYLGNKLRIACDMLSRNIVVNSEYECHLLEELLIYYQQHAAAFAKIPALSIYHQIYLMLLYPETETHYHQAKQALASDWQLFPAEEGRTLYSFILNYCVRKINSGQSLFYKEILDLYQFLLTQKIILKNDSITRWTFSNIFKAAIRLKEFEWAEQFILTYDRYLSAQERSNVVSYNLASLYYAQGACHKALQTLHEVEFNDPSFHTGAKIIQMKCYYELDETEAFFALLDAFNMYILRNKKLSTYQKRTNKNMLTLAKQIYELQLSAARLRKAEYQKRFQKLETKLNTTEPLANKDWLMTILKEI